MSPRPDYSANQVLRQDVDDPTLLRLQHGAQPADDDLAVGRVDDEHMATFLCEAHNAYVPTMQVLIGFPHPDAIPNAWRTGDRSTPLGLRDVARLLEQHLLPNSVGAPASSADGAEAAG